MCTPDPCQTDVSKPDCTVVEAAVVTSYGLTLPDTQQLGLSQLGDSKFTLLVLRGFREAMTEIDYMKKMKKLEAI